ncbi:MAG: hypothetical protein NDJ18_04160 [candidate division Zixibacteria bacterium]|nr:hypothetical protein [candidate division Zixibacteria bacterium]
MTGLAQASKAGAAMRIDRYIVATIYILLLCWPAVYRLTVPGALGDFAYYIVAYAIPVIVFVMYQLQVGRVAESLMIVFGVITVLVASIALADHRMHSFSTIFYAFKFYLTPIMLVYSGVHLASWFSHRQFQGLLVVIVAGHLFVSLLHYSELLPSIVYQANGQISENWSSVVGGYRAFVGLTLSKFDLAYQVGFLLVGAIFCSECFSSRSVRMLFMAMAAVLVVFTYNKTLALVVFVAIVILGYGWLRQYSKIIARTALGIIGLLIIGIVVKFLAGDIMLTDVYAFLSPQTFWSRVYIWQEAAIFDWAHLFRGMGAGSLAQRDVTLDNQFLYGYLELGVVGAAAYFTMFAAMILRISGNHRFGRRVLVLLCLTFVIGDILNAHALLLAIGLYLGRVGPASVTPEAAGYEVQRSTTGMGTCRPKNPEGAVCE